MKELKFYVFMFLVFLRLAKVIGDEEHYYDCICNPHTLKYTGCPEGYHALLEFWDWHYPVPLFLSHLGEGKWVKRMHSQRFAGTRGLTWFFRCQCGGNVFYSSNSRTCEENIHFDIPDFLYGRKEWNVRGIPVSLSKIDPDRRVYLMRGMDLYKRQCEDSATHSAFKVPANSNAVIAVPHGMVENIFDHLEVMWELRRKTPMLQ